MVCNAGTTCIISGVPRGPGLEARKILSDQADYTPEEIVQKLKGSDSVNINKALDFLISKKIKNPRYIPHILNLVKKVSNDRVSHKAMLALTNFKGFELEKDGTIKISVPGLRLVNGAILESGTIRFNNGAWFVENYDGAIISGLAINKPKRIADEDGMYTGKTNIFFDGESHACAGNYVSVDTKRKLMVMEVSRSDENHSSINFVPGNPFIPTEKNDSLEIKAYHKLVLFIENRAQKGLIPKVTIKGENGFVRFLNGLKETRVDSQGVFQIVTRGNDEGLYGRSLSYKYSAAPFELVVSDQKDNLLPLKTREFSIANHGPNRYRLILDNYERSALLDNQSNSRVVTTSAGKKFYRYEISTLLSDNQRIFTISDFKRAFPGIKLTGIIDSANIANALGLLGALPPKVRASIKGINFPSNNEFSAEFYVKGTNNSVKAGAYAEQNTGIINLWKGQVDIGTFRHEATHLWMKQLERAGSDFKEKWTAAAKDENGQSVYGGRHVLSPSREAPYFRWKDGYSQVPRYGCLRAYGCVNFEEDASVYAEEIAKGKSFKPFTKIQFSIEDPRYKNKLELLLKYGGITEKEFRQVTQ